MPGLIIRLTNLDTGRTIELAPDAAGNFDFSGLRDGEYRIAIDNADELDRGREIQNSIRLVDAPQSDRGYPIYDEEKAFSPEFVNYVKGANIAGFVKVADAMLAYGYV